MPETVVNAVSNKTRNSNGHTITKVEIPSRLQQLYDKSSSELQPNEKLTLKQLLNDCSDIFAKDDFDFGNFTEIEHSIVTRNAKSVRKECTTLHPVLLMRKKHI